MADKLPAFQFYPADWRKDIGVQSLSLENRAIWFEMLCIMHESEDRGKLVINGGAMSDEMIARLIGISVKKFQKTKEILKNFNIISVTDGVILNRRMVRDEYLRNVRKTAGSKGGNPNLVGTLVNQNSNQSTNQTDKQNTTPSSSSSSSSSTSVNNKEGVTPPSPPAKEKKIELDFSFLDESKNLQFKDVFREWWVYRVKEKKKPFKTQTTLQKAFDYMVELSGNSPEVAKKIVNQAIANTWQGLQPLKNGNENTKGNTNGTGGRTFANSNDGGLAGNNGRLNSDTGRGNYKPRIIIHGAGKKGDGDPKGSD